METQRRKAKQRFPGGNTMRYFTFMATVVLLAGVFGCHHGRHHHGCDTCGSSHDGPGYAGRLGPGGPEYAGPPPEHAYGGGFPVDPRGGVLLGGGPPGPPFNLPPSQMLMHPGPGVDGPGPGVLDVTQASGIMPSQLSQVRFLGPDRGRGMQVDYQIAPGQFTEVPLVAPASLDVPQGAIYRLRLTQVAGLPDFTFYPTLEIGPATPRTEAFLAHNKIPIQFTAEDFRQVISGNFVTKVIYLPDPEFQDIAAGVDELVSTRLDPGLDPIVEADRKGTILAIIRMGNKDLEPAGAGGAEGRQMGYQEGGMDPMGGPMGPGQMPPPVPEFSQPSTTPSYISGVTTVPYGMPYTATPIGLPGPPHLPLGHPAGLKLHSITNHTQHHIPPPTPYMNIHVKQTPGFNYPQPPNTMYLHERVMPGGGYPHPAVPMPAPGQHP